jgi:hypothetical protein
MSINPLAIARTMTVLLCCTAVALGCRTPPPPEPADPPVGQPETTAAAAADLAFAAAVTAGDGPRVLALLDNEASWTDTSGRTVKRAALAQQLPTPAITGEQPTEVRRFEYGRVAVMQVDRDRQHGLRVWVQRPEGWRLLIYHEVQSLPSPPTSTPGTGAECVNPCKTVPYQPTTDAQRGVIAAYQALETAAHAADVANWGTHVAEEFILVSSNSDRTFTREERLDGLRKSSFGGVSPTELMAAEMFDFDTVVVMRSQHRPAKGNPLQITRVWVNRNDVWGSTLSYQTAILPATAQ